MEQSYLPPHATISEACEWLQNETDEVWTLARLLEHGLMPWFWLDYRADADAVFAGRKQGYLAPLCFAGDAGRLANGSREVLVTMTRNHAGEIIGLPPGSLVLPLDDVRFRRDDLTQLASKFDAPPAKEEAQAGTSPSIEAWKANARKIGERIHKEKPLLNVEQIAEKTHDEMTARNANGEPGMTGRGGRVPMAGTIKKHAQTGIKTQSIRAMP